MASSTAGLKGPVLGSLFSRLFGSVPAARIVAPLGIRCPAAGRGAPGRLAPGLPFPRMRHVLPVRAPALWG